MTGARFASLAISVVGYKVAKNVDIQAALVHLEQQALRLEKDHSEILSPKIILNILPAAVQGRVYEHLDRLTTYEKVREKIVSLVQVSRGPDDMDCSLVDRGGEEQWPEEGWWPEENQEGEKDVNAFSTECYRC